ncbi:hypothetical protein DSUL_100014 [Desulfovibrionales bacterium]
MSDKLGHNIAPPSLIKFMPI